MKLIIILPFLPAALAQAFGNKAGLIKAAVNFVYAPGNDYPSSTVGQSYCYESENRDLVEGTITRLSCRPLICLEDTKPCLVRYDTTEDNFYFDPEGALDPDSGCCLGTEANCTEENQCGEQCPLPPDSCSETNADAAEPCLSADCYTCNNSTNGTELYSLQEQVLDIVCMSAGKAKTDDGQDYKWAIICGKHTKEFFGNVEDNRDIGDIDCLAMRQVRLCAIRSMFKQQLRVLLMTF